MTRRLPRLQTLLDHAAACVQHLAGPRAVIAPDLRVDILLHRFEVTIHDPYVDRRLITAMAVALDALQSR